MTGFPPDTQTHADSILNALSLLYEVADDDALRTSGWAQESAKSALDALLVELAAARTERDRWKEKAGRYMDWYRDETTPLRDALADVLDFTTGWCAPMDAEQTLKAIERCATEGLEAASATDQRGTPQAEPAPGSDFIDRYAAERRSGCSHEAALARLTEKQPPVTPA